MKCNECLTYHMCRNRLVTYMREYFKPYGGVFDTDNIIYTSAYRVDILRCPYIDHQINMRLLRNVKSSIYDSTVEVIKESFKIYGREYIKS